MLTTLLKVNNFHKRGQKYTRDTMRGIRVAVILADDGTARVTAQRGTGRGVTPFADESGPADDMVTRAIAIAHHLG